jgi:photosystem II stability/assembly factor-like uncharacterized protein
MDIHVHPCDRSTLYLTTDIEGMWRSTDGGATWARLGDLPDPHAGATWTQVSEIDMQHGGVDAFHASTGVLYIGALGGILRSEDDGVTFELVGPATSDGY